MGEPEHDVAEAAAAVRGWVDLATWTAIGLGLVFTAVNVQAFAAAGAPVGSPGWVVAWLLDPMVSVLLLAVVRAEQLTARWQVPMGWQVTAVKWAAFAATYAMNSWSAWRDGVPSSVVLHSVPPVFVLLAAEVAPALRERLTEAVRVAAASSYATDMETFSAPESGEKKSPHSEPVGAHRAGSSLVAPSDILAPPSPTSAPSPSSDDRTDPEGADDGARADGRVREIAELLAAGCEVTGAQAAALHQVSARTGRRLLGAARAHLAQHPPRPAPTCT
ncbi:hypothetical protein [Actinomycetospora soli]|uniref:hypothetical protein n=1 Tax=Actinomycetospora soli TaxID=2893887 RepID=UPI001E5D3530|nr:hypothetical protein [Actinomycetospora soli]MCD2190969.1 hypothetical protein [Actinomycetospora soli]